MNAKGPHTAVTGKSNEQKSKDIHEIISSIKSTKCIYCSIELYCCDTEALGSAGTKAATVSGKYAPSGKP
jgi:hypothetical protein